MGLRKPPKGGGVELPIVETPAGAEDIAAGKQAINDSGTLITGTVTDYESGTNTGIDASDTPYAQDGKLKTAHNFQNNTLMRAGAKLTYQNNLALLGDATAADVSASKTMTSAAGLKIAGTLPEVASGTTETLSNAGPSHASGNIRMTGTVSGDKIMRDGSKVMTSVGSNFFGNATAADVASGKTFTSAAGLNVVGTGVKTNLLEVVSFKYNYRIGNTFEFQETPDIVFIFRNQNITTLDGLIKFWGLIQDSNDNEYYAKNVLCGYCEDLSAVEIGTGRLHHIVSFLGIITRTGEKSFSVATAAYANENGNTFYVVGYKR